MIPFLAPLLNFGSGIATKVANIKSQKIALQNQKEMNAHNEHSSLMNAYAAEMGKEPKSWLDSFVDAMNRLVRPLIVYQILGLMWYAILNPEGFGFAMLALEALPEWLQQTIGVIITFYFGAKTIFREVDSFRSKTHKQKMQQQGVAKIEHTNANSDEAVIRRGWSNQKR